MERPRLSIKPLVVGGFGMPMGGNGDFFEETLNRPHTTRAGDRGDKRIDRRNLKRRGNKKDLLRRES